MAKREIIRIDEKKCNGCGLCIPNCPEGAIQVIDGKARLVSDLFCDGLGACIGHCPQGAISIEKREAEEYNEKKVMENIVKQGRNVIRAHLEHLKGHHQHKLFQEAVALLKERNIEIPPEVFGGVLPHSHGPEGCPSAKVMDFRREKNIVLKERIDSPTQSQLQTWPVQIILVPVNAPYFENADILIAADCVPFAYADFHRDLLIDRVLLVGCPKLDDIRVYEEKIGRILKENKIKSVTYAHMEVPCCFGLVNIIQKAINASGKDIPLREITISIKGERLDGG